MSKKYIAIISVLIVAIGGLWCWQSIHTPNIRVPADTAATTTMTSAGTTKTDTAASSCATATLAVATSTYDVCVEKGDTVLQVMDWLMVHTDFAYGGRDYPSLGYYVEMINGKIAPSGYYWILYLNDKTSDFGASQAHLKAGDRVEWKLEKSY